MHALVHKIARAKARLEQVAGRWNVFEVQRESDRRQVENLLERVRRHELNRATGARSMLESDTTGVDVAHDVFAVRDRTSARIVGCVRVTTADLLAKDAVGRQAYQLDRVPEALHARCRVVTHLAVLPEYRGTAASLEVIVHLHQWFSERGYVAALFVTEPGLYPMYESLGARPIASVYGTKAGYRIPVALILPDGAHLRRVGSPLAPLHRPWRESPAVTAALVWAGTLPETPPGAASLGFEFFHSPEHDVATTKLTKGMSRAGRDAFCRKALVVRCQVGESVVFQEDGGRQVGVVVAGALDVRRNGVSVGSLEPGEPFGEVAAILSVRRTASLVSTDPTTKVVLFSQRAFARLTRKEDQVALWTNLATLLAERLHATTARYADA